jgi:hypothetical protein
MTTFDPRGLSWDMWCELMADLFAAQQLGTVPEDRWREWGDGMAGIGYFMSSGVPDTRTFERWEDWAASLVGIMDIKP